LFYRQRSFTREEFIAFMFAQSKEYPDTRAILDLVASSGKYFVGAINNEPLELNQYRIEAFDLRRNFSGFLQFLLRSLPQTRRNDLSRRSGKSPSARRISAFSLMTAR